MDENVKAKLTAAWRAAVARLIEAGYDPADVYATMISVSVRCALAAVADRTSAAITTRASLISYELLVLRSSIGAARPPA